MLTTRAKVRIARYLSALIRAVRRFGNRSEIAEVRRLGLTWRLDLKEGIDLAIYLNCYERGTLKRYDSLVKAGSTVLDVGANTGVHTLYLARLVGPHGHVFAFEPTSFALNKLRENLALNPELVSRVTLYQSMLLASLETPLPSTVVSSWPLEDATAKHTALAGADHSTGGAQSDTLDGVVERWGLVDIDLIKIDVDGYELDVLHGGTKTLSARAPKIVMELCPHLHDSEEASFSDLIRFVTNLGYGLFDISTDKRLSANPSVLEKSIAWGAGKNVLLRKARQGPVEAA